MGVQIIQGQHSRSTVMLKNMFKSVTFTCQQPDNVEFYVTCVGFESQEEMIQFVFDFENFEYENVTFSSPYFGVHLADFLCHDKGHTSVSDTHKVSALLTRANSINWIQDFCIRPEGFVIRKAEFFKD